MTTSQVRRYTRQAIAYLQSLGCSATSGPVPLGMGFKEILAAHLFPAGATTNMPPELWRSICEAVELTYPGYALVNVLVDRRPTSEWKFSNNPEDMAGHSLLDLKSIKSRLRNSLRRFTIGSQSPHVAGSIGAAGELAEQWFTNLMHVLPDLLSKATDYTAGWSSVNNAIDEVEAGIGVHNTQSRELGNHLYQVYVASAPNRKRSKP